MDALQFAPYLRAAELSAALISICVVILWAVGRLGRAALGDVWWLHRGPKLAYASMLTIVFPAFLLVQYGPHGLLVYLIASAFLSLALLVATLYAIK
jgi:hypothetical protein